MYKCKACGNRKYFYEHNNIKTHLVLDEETGEMINATDEFLSCAEVCCDVCEASSEDKDIFDFDGNAIECNTTN
jgi:hypothetical protein